MSDTAEAGESPAFFATILGERPIEQALMGYIEAGFKSRIERSRGGQLVVSGEEFLTVVKLAQDFHPKNAVLGKLADDLSKSPKAAVRLRWA